MKNPENFINSGEREATHEIGRLPIKSGRLESLVPATEGSHVRLKYEKYSTVSARKLTISESVAILEYIMINQYILDQ